jgi:hypothetical protein
MTIKAMQQEIASLKETIAQQAEQIAGLVATNATLDAEWKKTTADKFAEMESAIRVKDAALDWCIGEFNLRLDDIDLSQETISVLSARHIQPSPEHLEAWYKSMVGEPVAYMQISVEEGVDTKFPRDHLPKKYNKEWWKFEPLHAIKPFPEILQNAGRLMFELQSVTEQQAEAIRLKDEALIAVRDDLELRMRIAEDDSLNISNSVLDQMCDAIDIQPSPEILQARDEKVAEACAKVIDTHLNRSTYSTSLAEMLSQILSGEWRKYI